MSSNDGVTGGFFKALALTMVAALGLSLLFARFLLPLIADGASLPQAVATLPEPRPSLTWIKESIHRHPDLAALYHQAQEDRADARRGG